MDNTINDFIIKVASLEDAHYAQTIVDEMEASAKARGTGIAKRSPDYIVEKMKEGKAVVAFRKNDLKWAGFTYMETWGHGKYVANSGLIVNPEFRKVGLAKEIKRAIFQLSRKTYPEAKIFGLTTGLAVMKINSDLGYEPVTYSELTDDDEFWKGCKSCVNYDVLMSKERKNCLCTAMLYDPEWEKNKEKQDNPKRTVNDFNKKSKLYERFMRIKNNILLRLIDKGPKALMGVLLSLKFKV